MQLRERTVSVISKIETYNKVNRVFVVGVVRPLIGYITTAPASDRLSGRSGHSDQASVSGS